MIRSDQPRRGLLPSWSCVPRSAPVQPRSSTNTQHRRAGCCRQSSGRHRGLRADVYLEATGHPSAVIQGLNLLRKLGTYVVYGVFGSDVTVDWSIIGDDKELNVLGAHLGPYCWPAAIRMIESGAPPMDKICTHQLPIAEFQKGLDLVASGKESVKGSLIP